LSKTLVVGVIILFVEMGSFTVVGTSIDYNSGISLITIKVDGEIGLNDWYVSDVGFDFMYESDDIAEIQYMIDGGEWQIYTEPFYLTKDGEDIKIEWCAVNHEGNYSDMDGPFIFSIDQTKPEIDLTYEVTGGNPEQGWEFTFTAIATDVMSGMDRVEFYKNDELLGTVIGPGPEYSWTFIYFPEPYVFFSAWAYDNAGNSDWDATFDPCDIDNLELFYFKNSLYEKIPINSGSYDRIIEYISNVNTVKSSSAGSENRVFDPGYIIIVFNRKMGNNGWIVSNATIPIYYESDRVDEVYYQIDGGSWLLYDKPLVISNDGNHDFSWYAVDSEGHSSTPETESFKIDRTSPEIILTKERLGTSKVKFMANVYDEISGIDKVKFSSKYGGDFTDYDFPFEWIWSGDLMGLLFGDKVIATVYDNAGNSNACSKDTWSRSHSNNQQIINQPVNLMIMRFLESFPFLEVFLRIMNLLR